MQGRFVVGYDSPFIINKQCLHTVLTLALGALLLDNSVSGITYVRSAKEVSFFTSHLESVETNDHKSFQIRKASKK